MRFPVHPQAWRKHGKNNYQNLLDQGIEYAQKAGLYVIIDWHSIGNLKSALFQSPNYDTDLKETFEFWRAMASRYKDNPTVAFLNYSMSLPCLMVNWVCAVGTIGKNQ